MILNLQFWGGDRNQAMTLARLIADLEDAPRKDVIFQFAARFDTTHDYGTINYVKNKFPVEVYTSDLQATGWPDGCNKLMAASYKNCIKLARQRNLPIESEYCLFLEADDVPLKNDWINRIMSEYALCGKQILGSWWGDTAGASAHVNGNMCMRLDFWRTCQEILNPRKRQAWDTGLWHYIKPCAAPSREIWNDWRLGYHDNPWRGVEALWEPKSFADPQNPLYGEILSPCLFHGCKPIEGLVRARELLIDKKV